MNEREFDGTIVLELLTRVDAVEELMAAVDSEDARKAVALMPSANINENIIAMVLQKMADPCDAH